MGAPIYGQSLDLTSSTDAWLNSYNTPPPKHNKPAKRIIVFIILSIIVVSLLVMVVVIITRPKPCLSSSDYMDLTGNKLEEAINSKNNFYTTVVGFVDNSADYAPAASDDIDINKMSVFYESHKDKSITISTTGYFPKGASEELSNERVNKINADFIQKGVPSSVLSPQSPIMYEPDTDESNGNNIVTVSITSKDSCRK